MTRREAFLPLAEAAQPSSEGCAMNNPSISNPPTSFPTEEKPDFVACPLCKQYSHSLGEDQLTEAFMVFQSMWSHRNDGIPTQFCFDEKARDAAQVLMAAARAASPQLQSSEVVERVADWWKPDPEDPFWMLEAEDGEWLKNADSLLGTRDATKAIRFPTEQDAYKHPARMKSGSKWWAAKPTEHKWVTSPAVVGNWQPIETAREHGSSRVVWVPDSAYPQGGRPVIAYTGIDGWNDDDGEPIEPTHFMDVRAPSAPAVVEAAETDCSLGEMHGCASTFTNKDGVRCCDFCGRPAEDLHADEVERMDEALFNLSDSIHLSGMLENDDGHARYEATVKAWNNLRAVLLVTDKTGVERELRDIIRQAADALQDLGFPGQG